jgi:hypothetical protein
MELQQDLDRYSIRILCLIIVSLFLHTEHLAATGKHASKILVEFGLLHSVVGWLVDNNIYNKHEDSI